MDLEEKFKFIKSAVYKLKSKEKATGKEAEKYISKP